MIKRNRLSLFLLMAAVIFLLTACGGEQYEGDFSFEIEDFTFTNQDNEEVSKSDFDGGFWVANFIFTNCETVCPPMTSNMANLQSQLSEAGLDEDVSLVSFTADPERDTPEALKEFGESRGASFHNWDFLTGYEFEEIQEFSVDNFKSALEREPDSDQMMHTIRFFLVSPEGNAIKMYTGTEAAAMEQIVEDISSMN
jgi:protein SCO1/2